MPFVTESYRISQKFGYIGNYLYLCIVKLKNKDVMRRYWIDNLRWVTVHVFSDCVTSYDLKKLPEMLAYYAKQGCEVITLNEL